MRFSKRDESTHARLLALANANDELSSTNGSLAAQLQRMRLMNRRRATERVLGGGAAEAAAYLPGSSQRLWSMMLRQPVQQVESADGAQAAADGAAAPAAAKAEMGVGDSTDNEGDDDTAGEAEEEADEEEDDQEEGEEDEDDEDQGRNQRRVRPSVPRVSFSRTGSKASVAPRKLASSTRGRESRRRR